MVISRCLLLVVAACALCVSRAEPRVAIWDPQGESTSKRFTFNRPFIAHAKSTLDAGGITARVLGADQLADPAVFSARSFDALVVSGIAFPDAQKDALLTFFNDGGILISLDTPMPFGIKIARDADGFWRPAPEEPDFAWQTTAISKEMGLQLKYDPKRHDLGVSHAPSRLLLKYLPAATVVSKKLPSLWVTPVEGAQFYALLRSARTDLHDAPSSLYVVRNGKRISIVSHSPVLTAGTDPAAWAHSDALLVALARLAADLRVKPDALLTDDLKVQVLEDVPLPEPLRSRRVTGSVNPENALPLVAWGAFNGSSIEFGEPLAAKQTKRLPVGAPDKDFPRSLEPGAKAVLDLPSANTLPGSGHIFLRIRGAFTQSTPGVFVKAGETVLFHEHFSYITALHAGLKNTGKPHEFTRIVFVPAEALAAGSLTIENTGDAKLYFDAVRLERRTRPGPDMVMGLGEGYDFNALKADVTRTWTSIRSSIRTNKVLPLDQPGALKSVTDKIDHLLRFECPVHLIAEGTPPWAAISQERYEESVAAKRPHTVPPDTNKYLKIIVPIAEKYRGKIAYWEIWNESDIQQFWRGTPEEFMAFYAKVAPAIKKADPHARIVTTLSGFNEKFLDLMIDSHFEKNADLLGFHPYAGKTPAWDMPVGLAEGQLMSRGVNLEIYCTESGFVFRNAEWFQPPPEYTPEIQRDLLNVAMARVLAGGIAKLNIFHAGGSGHPYGLMEDNGKPRPAYLVFADYLKLAQNGARRLDIGMTSPDGQALAGVYSAASYDQAGNITLVVNPAEAFPSSAPANGSSEFNGSFAGWTPFSGKFSMPDGTFTIDPDADKQAGFYTKFRLNPVALPLMEIAVTEAEGPWSLKFKYADGRAVDVVSNGDVGVKKFDLRTILPDLKEQDTEVSFRFSARTALDYVRFAADGPAVAPEPTPIAVRLRVPLPRGSTAKSAFWRAENNHGVIPLKITGADPWTEFTLPVSTRTVIEIR